MNEMLDVLRTLTEMPGPVGFEASVNGWLAERWRDRCLETEITELGNLVAHVGGTGPRILLLAHADEVGFVVKSMSDDGFLWIESWAGRFPNQPLLWEYVAGQPALILGERGAVEGVFATVTGHLAAILREREGIHLDADHVFVDIGGRSREEVQEWGVRVGTPIIWNPPTRRIGGLICGKAMDDRAGLAILDALLQRLEVSRLRYDVYLGSVVAEEIGSVGVRSLCRRVNPELAIVVETALVGDTPLVDPKDVPVRLKDGPVLIHKDNRVVYDPELSKGVMRAAAGIDAPIQHAVYSMFGTDGSETIREGTRTVAVGFPTRYTHSPFETVDAGDLQQTVAVLRAFLETEAMAL